MNSTFQAGAAKRSIVPSNDLIRRSPESFACNQCDVQGSPLQVKALALSSGNQRVLLVSLDLCVMLNPNFHRMRKAISEQVTLGTDEIIVTISHSHSAPYVVATDPPDPYFDFICRLAVEASAEAWQNRQPAKIGHDRTFAVGASFCTQLPLPNGGVYFTRDFRESLAVGRPVDPRLNVIRIDDLEGRPLAGWVRFAAHPACVIFNTPISAEYPGYLTDRLSETVAGGAPVLFGYGVSGDVNCVPLFGKEEDSRNLGLQLANLAGPVFEKIVTAVPHRFSAGAVSVDLPLDPVPSIETLDKEIEEIQSFIAGLDKDPTLVWILGVNCWKTWPVAQKKKYVVPLLDWTQKVKTALLAGEVFPRTWPSSLSGLIVDDVGLLFFSGEPYTALGLSLAAKSPLTETLLQGWGNGSDGYLGTDEDKKRGGYEMYTSVRNHSLIKCLRPLPYGYGAGDLLVKRCLDLIDRFLKLS